jgi:uncharacterized protein (TIGR03067 family)
MPVQHERGVKYWVMKKWRYTLSTKQDPCQVDLVELKAQAGDDTVLKGILKFEDDSLFICRSSPDGERPTDFDVAPHDEKHHLWILKRLEPTADTR